MDVALLIGAALMALAGVPHCVVMCGPACMAVSGVPGRSQGAVLALHAGRVLSYAVAGALAAAGVSWLTVLGTTQPILRPLWTLVHAAALGLGLWLLMRGRQPAWLERWGRPVVPAPVLRNAGPAAVVQWRKPMRGFGAGLAWMAWPCGLLQSALVVAALGTSAGRGAAIMATFGVITSLGLVLGPAAWSRWLRGRSADFGERVTWAVRFAGLMLVIASSWALGHDLWMKVYDYCIA